MMMMMAEEKDGLVLVTGASGFIALHIIQLLQKEGYKVRGTVRSLKNESKLRPLRELCPDAKHPLELVEADLTKDQGWDEAAKGCRYCLHVASPFPNAPPKSADDLIVPAVEGTKRVLQACANAGTIKRIVLTSSIAAVHGEYTNEEGRVYTEEDWTDLSTDDMDAYARSKTMAEKAAWDFILALPPERKIELATVNPGLVYGPCISGAVSTSLETLYRAMSFISMPLVPRLYLTICDVRDVALAHLRAMVVPEAANHRHLVISGHMWYPDICKVLKEEFGPYGYCISTWTAPDIAIYLISLVDSNAKLAVPRLNQAYTYSNLRMKNVLNIEPRPPKDVLLDTIYGLIESGALKKTRNYKSRI